jgi:hypothetical protein
VCLRYFLEGKGVLAVPVARVARLLGAILIPVIKSRQLEARRRSPRCRPTGGPTIVLATIGVSTDGMISPE